MSISKSYNKQNGVTYVYEVTENYWDKEKKRPQTKRKLIGKIDPETGEIIPTSRKKKNTENGGTQDYKTRYESAAKIIAQQEKDITDLKKELSSALSDELTYLSEIEHETLERKKVIEGLVRRCNIYG